MRSATTDLEILFSNTPAETLRSLRVAVEGIVARRVGAGVSPDFVRRYLAFAELVDRRLAEIAVAGEAHHTSAGIDEAVGADANQGGQEPLSYD